MCVCVCVCACVRACVRACARACVVVVAVFLTEVWKRLLPQRYYRVVISPQSRNCTLHKTAYSVFCCWFLPLFLFLNLLLFVVVVPVFPERDLEAFAAEIVCRYFVVISSQSRLKLHKIAQSWLLLLLLVFWAFYDCQSVSRDWRAKQHSQVSCV